MPLDARILATASINISPPKRQSYPTTADGLLYFFVSHWAVAYATFETFTTVKSLAMIALHPSVPNLILSICLSVCFKILVNLHQTFYSEKNRDLIYKFCDGKVHADTSVRYYYAVTAFLRKHDSLKNYLWHRNTCNHVSHNQ